MPRKRKTKRTLKKCHHPNGYTIPVGITGLIRNFYCPDCGYTNQHSL